MLQQVFAHLKNLPGWSTKRKLLVLESDDWGSTRLPSNEVREELKKIGIDLGRGNFMKLDTLASREDLNLLYSVLSSVRDFNGNHAVFSPFVNVTNADFGKIIESGYQKYFFEPFTTTLKRYHDSDVFSSWQEGIRNKIFAPEYHGREHFNVPLLMRFLQQGHKNLIEAFNRGVIHIPISEIKSKGVSSLAPAYFYDNRKDLAYLQKSIAEGTKIFENIFGFTPVSFVPPNGIFNYSLEEALVGTPLIGIVVDRSRTEPDGNGNLISRSFKYRFGRFNKYGQLYYIRNLKFEPVQKEYSREKIMTEIGAAFRTGKPAVISSHRINYVGTISSKHRDFALNELKVLLKKVIKNWPDVEFVSSGELVKTIKESLLVDGE